MKSTMKRYTVTRDGCLDLEFTGRLVGEGQHTVSESPTGPSLGTTVRLYLTAAGQVVASVNRHTEDMFRGGSSVDSAALHPTAADALAWLSRDENRDLWPACKKGWLQAAEAEPNIFAAAVEVE